MQQRGLVGTIEPMDNPFNEELNRIKGMDNKKRKNKLGQSEIEIQRKAIEAEKDPDIREELRQGNTVTIIEDNDADMDEPLI